MQNTIECTIYDTPQMNYYILKWLYFGLINAMGENVLALELVLTNLRSDYIYVSRYGWIVLVIKLYFFTIGHSTA